MARGGCGPECPYLLAILRIISSQWAELSVCIAKRNKKGH